MTFDSDSSTFESAMVCSFFCLIGLLPILVALRIRSEILDRQQGYPRWRNGAIYRFIVHPTNRITVSIIGGILLLFNLALLSGFVFLVLYITPSYGPYGWLFAIFTFAALGTGLAAGLILIVIQIRRRQRADSDPAAQDPDSYG